MELESIKGNEKSKTILHFHETKDASVHVTNIFRDVTPTSYVNLNLYEEKFKESFFILTEIFQTQQNLIDIILTLNYSLASLDEYIVNEVLNEHISKIVDLYMIDKYSDNEYN